jgi:hypothetical protein
VGSSSTPVLRQVAVADPRAGEACTEHSVPGGQRRTEELGSDASSVTVMLLTGREEGEGQEMPQSGKAVKEEVDIDCSCALTWLA